ncbi:C-C motif chemokine 27a [Pholidichthys leucotaenia]
MRSFPPRIATMNLKVVFVIVCVWALAISFTEAGIPKCCITTKMHVPKRYLLRVHKVEMQQRYGPCEIQALILHVRDLKKPICAHPKVLETFIAVLGETKSFKKKRAS